jgi:hypothetical protein
MGAMKNAIIEESEKAAQKLTARILMFPDPRNYVEQIERMIEDQIQIVFNRVMFPKGG